jgi:hypothetical protein
LVLQQFLFAILVQFLLRHFPAANVSRSEQFLFSLIKFLLELFVLVLGLISLFEVFLEPQTLVVVELVEIDEVLLDVLDLHCEIISPLHHHIIERDKMAFHHVVL